MVKPVLRSLMTVQIGDTVYDDEGGFAPLGKENYAVMVDVTVSPEDDDRGGDNFHFYVCSPGFIAVEHGLEFGNWQRSVLVIHPWSYPAVVAAVEKLCQGIDEPTWAEAATKLSRYMFWEFEDYDPNPTPRPQRTPA